MKSKFRNILLYVSIIVLLGSTTYIAYNIYTMYQEEQLFEKLQESRASYLQEEDDKKLIQSSDQTTGEKSILPEYIELFKENSDLYGWIQIEDSAVNYPVMYTPDNHNFYLRKDWKKENSISGSIFVDGRSNEDTENLIIYGHNMKNGTMFGSLEQYKEKKYYESHKYINFDTLYETATYEIIAVYSESENIFYENIELNSKEEFDEYIKYIKQNSYYDIESTAMYGDKIITLCTCDYLAKDARLLVVAKKIN